MLIFEVREFDPVCDCAAAEALERTCEVGTSGKTSLLTDLLGDPLGRVRNSPVFHMLVAETVGPVKEIVGLVRGCIKYAACGRKTNRKAVAAAAGVAPAKQQNYSPVYAKLAYILGLRVSPSHRRMGVGMKLVRTMEEWFKGKGAEYSYMATEKDNVASVKLFTARCGYSKFRTPAILVHPVFAHCLSLPRHVNLIKLSVSDAVSLYKSFFAAVEFFPRDIADILSNTHSLGTYLAIFSAESTWRTLDGFLSDPPSSWAVMSVWNCKEVYKLQLHGASKFYRGLAKMSRVLDRSLPWLKVPSFPNIFKPFGFYFLYGLCGEGPHAAELARALCKHAHNMARAGGCCVVATEVAACEPLRAGIPYWPKLSCEEDLWCVKRLADDYSDGELGDWTKAPPGTCIFVDPREV